MTSIAVSYLVMIIAVSVSSGFRHEIRAGISSVSGDIQLMSLNMNFMNEASPIEGNASYIPYVKEIDGVESVIPVIYRAGIVKNDNGIHGVLFKGFPAEYSPYLKPDSVAQAVTVPRRLAEIAGLEVGDRMLTYFVGGKVKARQFNVTGIYDPMLETDDQLVVYADIADLQRLNGWDADHASAVEIMLERGYRNEDDIRKLTDEVGATVYAYTSEDETTVLATSCISRYPQIFDWLNLLDFNVAFILILMTIVAGFNMISSLLILLFENISTIGLLKSLGMTDRGISSAFLARAAVLVAKGMAIGNALAFLFCIIQDRTHLMKLDPANYFVSFVPVDVNIPMVLAADAVSFAVIMLLLLIPVVFISNVDPARTVRVK